MLMLVIQKRIFEPKSTNFGRFWQFVYGVFCNYKIIFLTLHRQNDNGSSDDTVCNRNQGKYSNVISLA